MGRVGSAGWIVLGLLACGPAVDPNEADATSPAPGTGGSSGSPSDATGPSSATTNGTTTGNADDGTGSPFLVSPDGGGSVIACDLWSQDCPPGEKCMPWANDGGNTWNATRCTPIDDDPRSVGEPCTVVESGGVSAAELSGGADPTRAGITVLG